MNCAVSVIIPTRNRCELLRKTIASVTAQTHTRWEMIIVDDGSTDGTEKMLIEQASLDPRICFTRRARNPAGAPACRNLGLAAAQHEFILFLDSDDLLAPFCLEHRLSAFAQDSKRQIVIGQPERFCSDPGDLCSRTRWRDGRYSLMRALCLDYPWCTSSPLWRKGVFAEMGSWDETLQTGQDADLTTRALIHGFHAYESPEIDHFIRVNHSGVGARHCTSEGRESNLRRVESMRKLLQARNLLNRQTKLILAGNYFWIAQNFSSAGNLERAREVWLNTRRWSLLPSLQYCVGAILLGLQAGQRFWSRALAPLTAWLMPRGCLIWPFNPSTDRGRIDRRGQYRPVHCPQGAYGCAVDGDFSMARWLAYLVRRRRNAANSKQAGAFPAAQCAVPLTVS